MKHSDKSTYQFISYLVILLIHQFVDKSVDQSISLSAMKQIGSMAN